MSQAYIFLCISYEESFRDEWRILIENLRFEEAMEISFGWISTLVITGLKVVWVCVVNVFSIFIENLKLEKVDPLLEKIYIPKIFQMEYKLRPSPVRHNINLWIIL